MCMHFNCTQYFFKIVEELCYLLTVYLSFFVRIGRRCADVVCIFKLPKVSEVKEVPVAFVVGVNLKQIYN